MLDDAEEDEMVSLTMSKPTSASQNKLLIEDITISLSDEDTSAANELEETESCSGRTFTGIEELIQKSEDAEVIERPTNKESEKLLKTMGKVPQISELGHTANSQQEEESEDEDRSYDADLEDLD